MRFVCVRCVCVCECSGHLCRGVVFRVWRKERERKKKKKNIQKGCSLQRRPDSIVVIIVVIMHHYRSREDETSCGGGGGGDPYFYLRLTAGSAPYNNPIKLEVDVKPESRIMTPVTSCLQQHQGSPPEALMDTTDGGVVVCKEEENTGIGLLALTQLDGYGGYKTTYCNTDVDDVDKADKYSYGRLIYSSPDDIKHQVYCSIFFSFYSF